MKRLYIAGPMTGYPDLNFPAFHEAAAQLRAAGYEVVNPAELEPERDPKDTDEQHWAKCMTEDISAMLGCHAICRLPGWRKSKGAALELSLATRFGMESGWASEWLEKARHDRP